ncbi:MAG: peptidase S16 [Alphaproteobacteria bacterium]|nr:peptidase S16 [Alphaproteobacteria bacterium]
MNVGATTYRTLKDLPVNLPVFPLPGVLLLPRWSLPLNIFEPRYLNMVDDAMSGNRLIGMIQDLGQTRAHAELAHVGCAGRITTYSETDDGRYLITLSGICRFSLGHELDVVTPYRQVEPDWQPWTGDLEPPAQMGLPSRDELAQSLKRYTRVNQLDVDWDAVKSAPIETLINALCTGCPFGVMERQALLEAETLQARAQILITLLDMDVPGDDTSTLQ